MLIEKIEPLAERGVYLALGSFSNGPEADGRPFAIWLVDIRNVTMVFLTKFRAFSLASRDEFPYSVWLYEMFTNNVAPCNSRRRIARLSRY
jgi:hypothetical protein